MKKIIVILSLIILTSCSGNESYFDLQKQSLISCSNNYISSIYIKGLNDNTDYYRFSLKWKKNKYGVKSFNINEIDNGFETYTHLGKLIENSEFKLKPSSKYEIINNSKGDAAESSIIITTNENSKVINADKMDCN